MKTKEPPKMNIATTPREYQWQVPCNCGRSFPLISKHLEGDNESDFRLVCPHCKARYALLEAKAIIAKGRFICTAGGGSASGRASWQLPDARFEKWILK